MKRTHICPTVLCLTPLLLLGAAALDQPANDPVKPSDAMHENANKQPAKEAAMKVEYLEIVTPKVDETCKALAGAHGIVFGEPVAMLGNARTANLKDGGRIGVRAPLRANETPVVRPYMLVEDIEAAVKAAEAAGGEIALPPMELPGEGTFSIYILGGIEHGLWQR